MKNVCLIVAAFCLTLSGPISSQSTSDADFDGDGSVTFNDFLKFASVWNTPNTRCDLNGSGLVDFGDFLIFAALFGQSQPSSSPFEGHYQGRYSGLRVWGIWSFDIDSKGSVQGTAVTAGTDTMKIDGSVSDLGVVSAQLDSSEVIFDIDGSISDSGVFSGRYITNVSPREIIVIADFRGEKWGGVSQDLIGTYSGSFTGDRDELFGTGNFTLSQKGIIVGVMNTVGGVITAPMSGVYNSAGYWAVSGQPYDIGDTPISIIGATGTIANGTLTGKWNQGLGHNGTITFSKK